MKRHRLYILIFQLFSVCFLWGQTKKTVLHEEDYALWGILNSTTLSPDANFVSYRMIYPELTDTLFVKTTHGKNVLTVPKGHSGHFLEHDFYSCFTGSSSYQLIHLKTGAKKEWENIYYSQPLKNGNQLLLMTVPEQECSTLKIVRYDGTPIMELKEVTEFKISNDASCILFITRKEAVYSINTLDLSSGANGVTEIYRCVQKLLSPLWDSNGENFTYIEEEPTSKKVQIHYYNRQNKEAKKLDISAHPIFASLIFSGYNSLNRSISKDGSRVFFHLKEKSVVNKNEAIDEVEIWNAKDKQDYPYVKKYGINGNRKLGVWHLNDDTVSVIGKSLESVTSLNYKETYAVVENSYNYLPTTQHTAEKDYVVTSVQTGVTSPLVQKLEMDDQKLYFSPEGSKVLYIQNEQWWVYTFETQKYQLLTQITDFFMSESLNNTKRVPHGVAGWSLDGTSIFVYDAFDLWQVVVAGGKPIRLTKGREHQIIYRIEDDEIPTEVAWYSAEPSKIDLSKEIVLSMASNDYKSGFAILRPNGTCPTIVFEQKKNSQVHYHRTKNKIIFQREDFNLPPQVIVSDAKTKRSQLVFQSNVQHFNYDWGISELIAYQNKEGVTLKGALYYPINYEKGKKYPLVVQIYERLSSLVHHYIYPSHFNSVGFNTANLTGQGFFVLQPDIHYAMGNPGLSAVECVEAAVLKTLEKGDVDRNKVGLIGQSFGGYETFFITSQSKIFATGIAGAGVSDMISFYFTFGTSQALPDLWRFEHQQFRMGKSVFENMEGYRNNSALHYAEDFSIPLLTWTGTQDDIVVPEQTMKWYIAMRRLSKENIMLRYPTQGHSLSNPVQQKNLTIKIQQWFDYHLKDGKRQLWMTSD